MTADLRAFVAGDERAVRGAIEQYSPYLVPLVRSFARDWDEADDLLQATWIRAYEKRTTYGTGSFLGWLYAVCRSVCITRYRTARHRRTLLERLAGEPAQLMVMEAHEGIDDIVAAINELPERQRDAITYRLIEGRSTRETAQLMDCAEGTVKALLHQAVQRVRTMVKESTLP
ncbi:MAG: RNA polymerase sigma factor [Longimicrobiales bacterium]